MGYITIFGGTFNPPHIGHFEIISSLSKHESVEQVLLIPTKVPPHKDSSFLASENDRLSMLRLIADRFNNVSVSDIEFQREGKSYTVDTLREVKNIFPSSKLAITVGADMLVTLPSWKEYESIIKLCKIFTFFREGENLKKYLTAISRLNKDGADIEVIETRVKGVSSTEIREKIFSGADVSELLLKDVFHYIKCRGIYCDDV